MNPPPYLIVIGTSAGGMPALSELVSQLPASIPAAVLVVQHLAPESSGEALINRLSRNSQMKCQLAVDQTVIEAGNLYLAPPDRHLLLRVNRLLVTKGPRENGFRPAADTLFRSAAVSFGSSVIGIVLTGMLHDGTAGLDFIKRCGGLAVVQDPHDAEYSSMPESALRNVDIDYTVPLARMGALLIELTHHPLPPQNLADIPLDLKTEAAIAERVVGTTDEVQDIGHQVPLTCPDCGGALWQLDQGNVLRFRCHTGHAFTAEALLDKEQNSLEETLWVAIRMMEERKILLTSMASRGSGLWSVQQEERIEELKSHINRLREFLLNGSSNTKGKIANTDRLEGQA
ncbi:chemotaxis protein CheB [Hymenobacter wooponensis]|uniref:chemotaxis protein CheB n=1 Tax=Hymenobacter wooponensis TaxID=1525360 RepID=UPI00143684F1|nr:chemotaxis protein CheB [Hymenobacter wooponensis]